jgi:alkylation response protein AidB-like acyl-CoA dehydrogenase
MDFLLTQDQLTLAESVRRFLAETHGPSVLRRLDAGRKRDAGIWLGLVDLGVTGVCVPEDQGGMGLSVLDAALIAVEAGRACLAEPLVDTAFIAAPWLARNGVVEPLQAIAEGRAKVALAHRINPWIADLDQATYLLAPTAGARRGPLHEAGPIAEERLLVSIDPLRRLFAADTNVYQDPHLLDLAALMSAAQLVGLAEAMLAQATNYAKVRQQFGQPIGAFQAVKHQLANALVAIEFAKPVVWRAAAALHDDRPHASIAVSHAKLAAGDAAWAMSEIAIQVHGAMGYTYEVDLHYWMKRSWALIGAWGDRAFHTSRIDAAVIGGVLPIGPEHTFA